ncbi:NADH-quinone oxidoreductase subunit N [Spongiactinospora sp. TRM90649]|uniref:NADH-quinone oxidoreductase subunit N n=1 Tax=Spongiactinospora sp. TRM90649 TaxID=3031114 RepID=UPI0023F7ABFD|nr:NADH-quinone oxidoreductase subunit N [Spongiactinospora sp. TRM90649]MDF5752196.1 NADH-quinone oxidoreductase subunit N [Spongiactinospora sp. TRM90649]
MTENPIDLLPELLTLAGAVAGLLTGAFVRRERQGAAAWICAAALAAAAVAAFAAAARPDGMAFGAWAIDAPTHVARVVVAVATLGVIALARCRTRGHPREAELYALFLLTALGTVTLAATTDLLLLIAGYLLASMPAYALAGHARSRSGTEAALKYYLMGAFLGVPMLAGVTLLFGWSGTTAYAGVAAERPGTAPVAAVLVLAGVLFKAGAVPAHFWVPDVTQGAPIAVAAFVTTVPKIGAFAALLRLGTEVFAGEGTGWAVLIGVVAPATMTLGNLAAFRQDDVRRLLAYSTISQAGYILVPVAVAGRTPLAVPALLYYLGAYAVTNLGAFAVVAATRRTSLEGQAGLARGSPGLAVSLTVCLLGLVGTPPTAVFIGKLLVLGAAWDGGQPWLAVAVVLNTVASLFYYLRWIRPVFTGTGEAPGITPVAAWIAHVAAVVSILLGVGAGVLPLL